MRFLTNKFLILVASGQLLVSQSNVGIIASGYIDPSVVVLAPGQVTTLYLRGVKNTIPQSNAATAFPLPTVMSGLSITIRQFSNVDPIPIPILAVNQLQRACPGSRPLDPTTDPCRVVAVTIQVPTDGLSIPRPFSTPDPNRHQELVVSENGSPSPGFAYAIHNDNIHVVTVCEPTQASKDADCSPQIRHADGKVVDPYNPALPGETILVYALGLGGTNPSVSAGSISPLPPATTVIPLGVYLNFAPNAPPSRLGPASATVIVERADFAGLTPGYAGLYQVNFKVPEPPPGTPACLSTGVQTNVTVTLSGYDSFDGARFCVKVPDPQQQ